MRSGTGDGTCDARSPPRRPARLLYLYRRRPERSRSRLTRVPVPRSIHDPWLQLSPLAALLALHSNHGYVLRAAGRPR
jgi:hypothetical protein